MFDLSYEALAALIGLSSGVVLGLAARLGNFCTLAALEMALYGQDQRRLRLWGVVLGTAILGSFVLASTGAIDLANTFYHQIAWAPVASILGGLIFGYGMALAGNCGFGALVRFGGGDLRSLVVVVVIGVFAFVTLSGPLAPLRVQLFPQQPATGGEGIATSVEHWIGLPPLATAAILAAAFFAFALSYRGLREAPREILWGSVVGLAVVASFWGTSWLHHESFGEIPVEGPSYTAPMGRAILYLMTSTAGGLSYSVGSVFGIILGALMGSLLRGRFRWEACDDPRELGRQVGGAALMGIGGVLALGCSVGQGVSAFATLAWSAPVTLAAIAVGAVLGLKQMIGADG